MKDVVKQLKNLNEYMKILIEILNELLTKL